MDNRQPDYRQGDLVRVNASIVESDLPPIKPPKPGDILRVVSGLSDPIEVEHRDGSGYVFNIDSRHVEPYADEA